MGEPFNFSLNENPVEVSIVKCQPELTILSNKKLLRVQPISRVNKNCFTLLINGETHTVWWAQDEDAIYVRLNGRTHTVSYKDPISASQKIGAGDDTILADMPGIVVKVNCNAGDDIKMGDVLIVFESMKMQINVTAPRDGVIDEVHIAPNATFGKKAELISLKGED